MSNKPHVNTFVEGSMGPFRTNALPSLQLPPLQETIPVLPLPIKRSNTNRPLPLDPLTRSSSGRSAEEISGNQFSTTEPKKSKAKCTGQETATIDTEEGISDGSRQLEHGTDNDIIPRLADSPRKRQRRGSRVDRDYVQLPLLEKKKGSTAGGSSFGVSLQSIISPIKSKPQTEYSSSMPFLYPPPATEDPPRGYAPAVFEKPPRGIASSAFEDAHGRNALNGSSTAMADLDIGKDHDNTLKSMESKEEKEPARGSGKKVRSRQNKKWTKDETEELFKAIAKHGVGHWAKMSADAEFKFNNRSKTDLKDRYRICFPTEKNKDGSKKASKVKGDNLAQGNSKVPSNLLDLLINEENSSSAIANSTAVSSTNTSTRKLHQMGKEDLAKLGIQDPLLSIKQTKRKAWTEKEDKALEEGFDRFGPQWAKILAENSQSLSIRNHKDLRDRFRNKFPKKYEAAGFTPRTKPAPRSMAPVAESAPEDEIKVPSPPSSTPPSSSKQKSRPEEKDRVLMSLPPLPDDIPSSTINLLLDFPTSPSLIPNSSSQPDLQRLILDHVDPLQTLHSSAPVHLRPFNFSQSPSYTQTSTTTPMQRQSSNPTFRISSNRNFSPLPPPNELHVDPLLEAALADSAAGAGPSSLLQMLHPPPALRVGDSSIKGLLNSDSARDDGITMGLQWEDMATQPLFEIDGDRDPR